jgi:L-cysteine S-thiosulfotransferase
VRELALALMLAAGSAAAQAPLPEPLTATPGDAERGRAIAASRQQGLCVLCHAAPLPDPHLQGNLGPDLAGVGARLTVQQLRARLLDPRGANPESIMPAYGTLPATQQLQRVPASLQGRPLLTPQQIEDVVAWLASLK